MLTIDKNVPVPEKITAKPRNLISELAQSMKCGDSVLCPDLNTSKKLAYQLGKFSKVVTRKEGSGIRVWRQRKERKDGN